MQNMHVHRIRTAFITLSCNNGLSAKPNKLTNKMVKNKKLQKEVIVNCIVRTVNQKKFMIKSYFIVVFLCFP